MRGQECVGGGCVGLCVCGGGWRQEQYGCGRKNMPRAPAREEARGEVARGQWDYRVFEPKFTIIP